MRRLLAAAVALAFTLAACTNAGEMDRVDSGEGDEIAVDSVDAEADRVEAGVRIVDWVDSVDGERERAVVEAVTSGLGSVWARPDGVALDKRSDLADRVFLEIAARRADSGGVEVGVRPNATAALWLPVDRIFDDEDAVAGDWWSSSPIVPGEAGTLGWLGVRVRARRLDDGRLELALTTPSGREVWPRERIVGAGELSGAGWVYASPIVLSTGGDPALPAAPADPARGGFESVSLGERFGLSWRHACGIRADRKIDCWGNDSRGQASPPVGEFVAVSAGYAHTCAIRVEGDVTCWGGSPWSPPAGPFVEISAAGGNPCGIRPDGRVECWSRAGAAVGDEIAPPAGAFTALSTGRRHACGLRVSGEVACWGSNAIRYLSFDVIVQWEPEDGSGPARAPRGAFAAVTVGHQHSCGIRPDGSVECWGDDANGQSTPPPGTFTALSAANGFTCGLRPDGRAECWGGLPADRNYASRSTRTEHAPAPAPTGQFAALSAGAGQACGLRADGTAVCWGDNTRGQVDSPTSAYRAVTAGAVHTCGLRFDGIAECWGGDDAGQSSPPDWLPFDEITAGSDYTCGRSNETVACWGADLDADEQDVWVLPRLPGQTEGPSTFAALSAGAQVICGILLDGSAECSIPTGRRIEGTPPSLTATRAPTGTFTALDAGAYHTCALGADATISCWGENTHAQATPPAGTFAALSSGQRHSCALRAGGEITCWGENTFGQARPPTESFSELSAGAYYNCALDAAGAITCWATTPTGRPRRRTGASPPSAPASVTPAPSTRRAPSPAGATTPSAKPAPPTAPTRPWAPAKSTAARSTPTAT